MKYLTLNAPVASTENANAIEVSTAKARTYRYETVEAEQSVPNTKKIALTVFVLACIVRLIALWIYTDDNIGTADQSEYLALAQNIKLHGVFSYGAPHTWGAPGLLNTEGPFVPTAARAPLFPLFVASLWWGEDRPLLQIRLAQCLMGGLVAVLVYLIGLGIFGRRTALFAGLGMAFAPVSATLPVAILTESLFTFLLTLGMWLWGRKYFVIAGVVLGMATLTRAILLPILAAIALMTVVLKFNRATHLKLLLGAVLVIAPWAVRNAITQHAFVPVASTGWGANIFLGTFDIPYGAGNLWPIVNKDEDFINIVYNTPTETAAEGRLMQVALERIRASPLHWIYIRIKQFPRLFVSSGNYLLPVLPLPEPMMRVVYPGANVLFLLLSAWGLFQARAQWRRVYPLTLVSFIFCAAQFPGVGEERYITPIVPFLMVFAGYGLAQLTSWRGNDAPGRPSVAG
jgi:4-amino-4-deoxy-L-arabinose transferase-like glycosyltransferase